MSNINEKRIHRDKKNSGLSGLLHLGGRVGKLERLLGLVSFLMPLENASTDGRKWLGAYISHGTTKSLKRQGETLTGQQRLLG